MKGPKRIETARLVLRKPNAADAEAIFSRYEEFPNLAPREPGDVLCYARIFD